MDDEIDITRLSYIVGIIFFAGLFLLFIYHDDAHYEIDWTKVKGSRAWHEQERISMEQQLANVSFTCCYPYECPEAKNNPDDCICVYAVYCGEI